MKSSTHPEQLSPSDVAALKAPFPKDRLGVKVQSLSKDRTRAMLVLYLQHTDVMERIEQVDPAWSTEVLAEERHGDTVYARIRMTIKGVSRENVGEGGDPKAAYSDALKRCAMLFGVGRYLYESSTVWTEYQENRDRFRQWGVQDYENSLKSNQEQIPEPKPGLKTSAAAGPKRPRENLNRTLMNLYRPYLTKFPETRFVELLQSRYQVGETRLMSVEQIEDLVQYLEQKLKSVA